MQHACKSLYNALTLPSLCFFFKGRHFILKSLVLGSRPRVLWVYVLNAIIAQGVHTLSVLEHLNSLLGKVGSPLGLKLYLDGRVLNELDC